MSAIEPILKFCDDKKDSPFTFGLVCMLYCHDYVDIETLEHFVENEISCQQLVTIPLIFDYIYGLSSSVSERSEFPIILGDMIFKYFHDPLILFKVLFDYKVKQDKDKAFLYVEKALKKCKVYDPKRELLYHLIICHDDYHQFDINILLNELYNLNILDKNTLKIENGDHGFKKLFLIHNNIILTVLVPVVQRILLEFLSFWMIRYMVLKILLLISGYLFFAF